MFNAEKYEYKQTSVPTPEANSLGGEVINNTYTLDGKDLKDWGIYGTSSTGRFSVPKLKGINTVNYAGYNGEIPDFGDISCSARDIKLTCFMQRSGRKAFASTMQDFIKSFIKSGMIRLKIDIHPDYPLCYDVYLGDAVRPEYRLFKGDIVAVFDLTLREAEPFKYVYKYIATSTVKVVNFTFTNVKNTVVTASWGDDARQDIIGTGSAQTVTHTFDVPGTYYILLSAAIYTVTNLTTVATLLWHGLD